MHLGRLDIFDKDSIMSDLYVTIMGKPIIVLFDLKVEEKDTCNFTLFQYLHEVERVQLAPTTSAYKIIKKSTPHDIHQHGVCGFHYHVHFRCKTIKIRLSQHSCYNSPIGCLSGAGNPFQALRFLMGITICVNCLTICWESPRVWFEIKGTRSDILGGSSGGLSSQNAEPCKMKRFR